MLVTAMCAIIIAFVFLVLRHEMRTTNRWLRRESEMFAAESRIAWHVYVARRDRAAAREW